MARNKYIYVKWAMAENKKWSEVGEISTPSGTTKICVIHAPEGSGDPSNKLIDAEFFTNINGGNAFS